MQHRSAADIAREVLALDNTPNAEKPCPVALMAKVYDGRALTQGDRLLITLIMCASLEGTQEIIRTHEECFSK